MLRREDNALEQISRLRYPRTARVIGGLDSSDIFCNSDYKHVWHNYFPQFGRITTLWLNPEGLVRLL
jgi:hypothetical protein